MKNLYKPLVVLALFWGISIPHSGAQTVTLPQVSPKATISQTVGIAQVTVTYSRPNVVTPQGQDRTGQIWGALVPYGLSDLGFGSTKAAPWRAGANENTLIEFSHDATFGGKSIEAGEYGLHMVLSEDGAVTVILSHDTHSWGSFFYDPAHDALRVNTQWEDHANTPLLTYSFPEADLNSATLVLDWEQKRIPIKISFDTPELTYQNLTNELKSIPGFDYQNWIAASSYLSTQGIHSETALEWADNAINAPFVGQKNFNSLSNKAQILNGMGESDKAAALMDEALEDPTANIQNYYNYGRTLIAQGKTEKALEVFSTASKKWPDHWLAPHGLARGLSATGSYKKALKYEREAFALAPDASKPFLEGYLKALEEGKDFN
ncbi:DUF2911 domain-containing protein [Fulvivirga sedimenti]|uniref:DUF2911 domain-containing protein n=1 Tax=Fulvivirga sedimenti TaxID=2879465 RepID=A0A9X1HVB2_9BACT|nr:DUF2911 domain-containing protein [Fulvivirga sedimenti]MCA6078600.1 DUF2911 domain-containing protein [Fulvivirga sedimenti]